MADQTDTSNIGIDELIEDIKTLGNISQQHDQTIFQLIASINGLQRILLDKESFTLEELTEATEAEASTLQKKIIKATAGEEEVEPTEGDSNLNSDDDDEKEDGPLVN